MVELRSVGRIESGDRDGLTVACFELPVESVCVLCFAKIVDPLFDGFIINDVSAVIILNGHSAP